MAKFDKLIAKVKNGRSISFEEAETILLNFIKKRAQLLPYQVMMIKEVIEDHEK